MKQKVLIELKLTQYHVGGVTICGRSYNVGGVIDMSEMLLNVLYKIHLL